MAPDDVARASIGDYAIVGDCRSAALISRPGSVDWLCWPQFDSPSIFGALLDAERGGSFRVGPAQPSVEVTRRYAGPTNVLETVHRTAEGSIRVTDCMSVASESERPRRLTPDRELLRIVECIDGEVEVEVDCRPRPDYARAAPALRDRGALGFYFDHGARSMVLRSDMPLRTSTARASVGGRISLRAGDRRCVSLVHHDRDIAVLPALGREADVRLAQTLHWWNDWASQCAYEGPWHDAVMRSALALKLMCFAPSGAVVAAPTTSLPERVGGARNWDYRYCWVRDASLTMQALFDLGYSSEAAAFVGWLLYITRMTRPELQILYDVFGEPELDEKELTHLSGFMNSRPVRIGNAAHDQLQLDVYGEVVDAVCEFERRGGVLDRASRGMLRAWGDTVCRRWHEPDEGIWESRSGRRHHTYSKVMCWVALERLLELQERGQLEIDAERYRRVQRTIRDAVEEHGYNAGFGSYVSEFGSEAIDASLLLLARFGYADSRSERMAATYRLVRERLGRNGLLYRYHAADGLVGGEGAFGICSFWAVAYLARAGRIDGA